MGLNLFVSSSLFDKSIGEVMRSVLPFTGIMMVAVLLVTFVPTISLGPVNWLQGRDIYVPFPSERPAVEAEDEEGGAPAKEEGKESSPGKSLGDLMKESGGFGDDEDDDDWDLDDDEDEDEDEKAKSLQDLMKESGAFDEDDDL
jgi:C4-dicarboxylate transporter DctM subunit